MALLNMTISKGSVASQGGWEPVFLRKPITTSDFPGGWGV